MTPVAQEFRHDPANGVWGDCHRACLATLLDLPLSEVPHFFHGCLFDVDGVKGGTKHADIAFKEMEEWLNPRGFTQVCCLYGADLSIDQVLATIMNMNHFGSSLVYILGGTSGNGFDHSVIGCNGEIAWDPHPKKPGIVGPTLISFADGSTTMGYYVHFIGHAITRIAR